MAMDWNLKRRKHERAIASEIANELNHALGPALPEVGEKHDIVCGIFADAFDRHHVVSEASGARILKYTPKILAALHADLNRKLDAAVRPPMPNAEIVKRAEAIAERDGGTWSKHLDAARNEARRATSRGQR